MPRLLLIAIVVMSKVALACFAPRGGPEYDRLISIEKLEPRNTYRVTVPSHLEEDLRGAQIILAYSKYATAGGIPVYEPKQTLEAIEKNGKRSAVFEVERRAKLRPYVVVMWWNKIDSYCGVQANSGFLEVE